MSAPKITVELSDEQRAWLEAKVADGTYRSVQAALAAGIDALAADGAMVAALDDPAFVEELRRRASDPPEMFEEFDSDEMMARLRARRAGKTRSA